MTANERSRIEVRLAAARKANDDLTRGPIPTKRMRCRPRLVRVSLDLAPTMVASLVWPAASHLSALARCFSTIGARTASVVRKKASAV
jgi:hypothetical protein